MKNYKHFLNDPVFETISEVVEIQANPAYVIGGFVRDCLLGREAKDIDIVVLGSGMDLAKKIAEKLGKNIKVQYFKNFGTARINYKDYEIELVGARKESYRKDSRKPIVENGSLKDDQNRRDFTVNAMAFSLNKADFGDLVDPFNGLQDIEDKVLKTPLNPDITYSDDPLRMLRAIRFATQLNFTIQEDSFEAIIRNADRLPIISKERIATELNKIMQSSIPSVGIKLLMASGLLKFIMPELIRLKGVEIKNGIGHKDNFYHTLEVLDNVAANSDDLWLRWAALLHDIAKPTTKRFNDKQGWTFHGHEVLGAKMAVKIFKKLKLPMNEKLKFIQKMIQLHLRPIALVENTVTDSAVRRLLFEAGNDIDNLMILCHADITSKNMEKVERYHNNFELVKQKLIEIEEKDRIRNWEPPISGDDIMKAFNMTPGPKVGIIKKAIREAVLDGVIPNELEHAYELMIIEGRKLDLEIVYPLIERE